MHFFVQIWQNIRFYRHFFLLGCLFLVPQSIKSIIYCFTNDSTHNVTKYYLFLKVDLWCQLYNILWSKNASKIILLYYAFTSLYNVFYKRLWQHTVFFIFFTKVFVYSKKGQKLIIKIVHFELWRTFKNQKKNFLMQWTWKNTPHWREHKIYFCCFSKFVKFLIFIGVEFYPFSK